MNTTHLDKEAALRWQWGEVTEAERAHVAACDACRGQVEPLAQTLSTFTLAARAWGDAKAAAAPLPSAQELRHPHAAAPGWWRGMAITAMAVGAMLLLVITFAMPRWRKHSVANSAAQQAAVRQQQRQQQITQDDALLEAVDQDVSQVVPQARSPLSGSAAGTSSSQSQQ